MMTRQCLDRRIDNIEKLRKNKQMEIDTICAYEGDSLTEVVDTMWPVDRQSLLEGDTAMYDYLKNIMFTYGHSERILFNSVVMAKQYHYVKANKDVHRIIDEWYKMNKDFPPKGAFMQHFLNQFDTLEGNNK